MITVSRKTALALNGLGWDKPTKFRWVQYRTTKTWDIALDRELEYLNCTKGFCAPTAQEIIDELPDVVECEKYSILKKLVIYDKGLAIYEDTPYSGSGDNLTEALAQLWLKLKKDNLLPNEV